MPKSHMGHPDHPWHSSGTMDMKPWVIDMYLHMRYRIPIVRLFIKPETEYESELCWGCVTQVADSVALGRWQGKHWRQLTLWQIHWDFTSRQMETLPYGEVGVDCGGYRNPSVFTWVKDENLGVWKLTYQHGYAPPLPSVDIFFLM